MCIHFGSPAIFILYFNGIYFILFYFFHSEGSRSRAQTEMKKKDNTSLLPNKGIVSKDIKKSLVGRLDTYLNTPFLKTCTSQKMGKMLTRKEVPELNSELNERKVRTADYCVKYLDRMWRIWSCKLC